MPASRCVDVRGVDGDRVAGAPRRVERDVVEQPLHHRVEPARADVLLLFVDRERDLGEPADAVAAGIEVRRCSVREQRLRTGASGRRRWRSGSARSRRPTAKRARRGSESAPAARGSGRTASTGGTRRDAMNRMWSVLIIPYLVVTVVPSTSGSRSRCTPWRDTSAPCISERGWRSCRSRRGTRCRSARRWRAPCALMLVVVERACAASSSVSAFSASATFIFCSLRRPPPICWNMPWIWLVRSSMPGGAMISICGGSSDTSTSISLSSSLPSRSILRNFWRVAESVGLHVVEVHFARRRQQHVEHALLGGVRGAVAHLARLGLARLLDRRPRRDRG